IPGVGKEKIVVCGAVLISPRYALTAAHCPGFIDSITVYGGVYDTNNLDVDGAQSSAIKDFFPHPKFYGTGPMVYNDIAVIELETEFHETDSVKFIKIDALYPEPHLPGADLHIVGFGADNFKDGDFVLTTRLHSAEVKSVDHDTCQREWSKWNATISSEQICTSVDPAGTGPGDSGAPLIYKRHVPGSNTTEWRLLGVSSTGTTPPGESPDVFTRVPSFCAWIGNVTMVACTL
uniref:Peptidase S1 domain-containing protein n=1 Tax=Steinernema glaseri TaxID=37863 RepID=A0A1I7YHN2_9BILA